MSDSQEEKHHWKRADTIHHKGSFFQREHHTILLVCSDCGDTKVIEL